MDQGKDGMGYVDEYLKWLRANSSQTELKNFTEVGMPYLDAHNDCLQLYVRRIGDNYYLTDDGITLRDLAMRGYDIKEDVGERAINRIAQSFGVRICCDDICTEATVENIGEKQHNMYQAMLRIGTIK